MTDTQASLPLPQPTSWSRPKGKHACGRDPAAGPGSCYHWWDGCPRAEKRGCYLHWRREQQRQADAREVRHG